MASTQSSRNGSNGELDREWQLRCRNLPRLHLRAQALYNLVFGAITQDDEGTPKLPANLAAWFKLIHTESDANGFQDALDLLNSFTPAFAEC